MHSALFIATWAVWAASAPPGTPVGIAEVDGRLVVGTEQGLWVESAGAAGSDGWLRRGPAGPVLDLSANAERALAAGPGAAWTWSPAHPTPEPTRLPELVQVAVDDAGRAWLAGHSGLWQLGPAAGPARRDPRLPTGPVTGVAAVGGELWVSSGGVLWRARGDAPFERVIAATGEGWHELCGAGRLGEQTLICVPRGVWAVGESERRADLGIGVLHDLVVDRGRLWVASETGVHHVPWDERGLAGAPERVIAGPGATLARGTRGLLAATPRGVAVLEVSEDVLPPAGAPRAAATETDLGVLRRAVLARQGLAPEALRRVEREARRSAWWPELSVGLRASRDRARSRDSDEVFSSGSLRRLFDHGSDRDHSLSLDVDLSWDLADLYRPDHALDVSRERRQVVQLRDQVLDRVHRLYFERRRVLARLAALAPDSPERPELRLRAQELGAQLDGWTGGVFTRPRPDSPHRLRRTP